MVEPPSDSVAHRGGIILAAQIRGPIEPIGRLTNTTDIVEAFSPAPEPDAIGRAILNLRCISEAEGALARALDRM